MAAKVSMTETKLLSAFLVIGLGMGILFDYLFFDRPLGISAAVFIALGTLLTLIVAQRVQRKLSVESYFAMATLIVFGIFLAVRLDYFLVFANTVMILFAGAILIATVHGESLRSYGVLRYVGLMGSPFIALRSAGAMVTSLGKGRQSARSEHWTPYLRGILLAIPLLILFALLFSSADQVFSELIGRTFHLSIDEELIARIIEVFSVGLVIAGAFGRMFLELDNAELTPLDRTPVPTSQQAKNLVGATETLVVLSLLNALFLVFIAVQIRYLFGSHATLASLGITYSEYARQGFGQLIVTAILSFLVLWVTHKLLDHHEPKTRTRYLWAAGLLTAQVGVILASAYKRLALYESAYGFTLDRFWAHTIIVVLIAAFGLLIYKLLHNQKDGLFLRSLVLLIVITLASVNILNPDAFVARQNIARFQTTGKIDIDYLGSYGLTEDAIPVAAALLDSPQSPQTSQLARAYYDVWVNLKGDYYQQWQSYHFSRARALKVLDAHAAVLEANKEYTGPPCAVSSSVLGSTPDQAAQCVGVQPTQ